MKKKRSHQRKRSILWYSISHGVPHTNGFKFCEFLHHVTNAECLNSLSIKLISIEFILTMLVRSMIIFIGTVSLHKIEWACSFADKRLVLLIPMTAELRTTALITFYLVITLIKHTSCTTIYVKPARNLTSTNIDFSFMSFSLSSLPGKSRKAKFCN